MGDVLSRREFFLGRDPRAGMPRARIGAGCLDRQGIVCQACRDACPPGAVRFLPMAGGTSTPVVDDGRCTGCGDCIAICPAHAITLEGTAA